MTNTSVEFFDAQFRRQIAVADFKLNPFEEAILPFVRGEAIDLGCGLGNLALAAARNGATVLAIDASASAVGALAGRAASDGLAVRAELADLANYRTDGQFDTVLCVGLLMFLAPDPAYRLLEQIKRMTRPGGVAAVNVLVEGTTYLDMFDQDAYTLFPEKYLDQFFGDWEIGYSAVQDFDAAGAAIKRFSTVVATKPRPTS